MGEGWITKSTKKSVTKNTKPNPTTSKKLQKRLIERSGAFYFFSDAPMFLYSQFDFEDFIPTRCITFGKVSPAHSPVLFEAFGGPADFVATPAGHEVIDDFEEGFVAFGIWIPEEAGLDGVLGLEVGEENTCSVIRFTGLVDASEAFVGTANHVGCGCGGGFEAGHNGFAVVGFDKGVGFDGDVHGSGDRFLIAKGSCGRDSVHSKSFAKGFGFFDCAAKGS